MSSQASSPDAPVDLAAVNGGLADDGGVREGARILAFSEAVMGGELDEIRRARDALSEALSPEAVVDAAGVIGAFNIVDRIADSTGIALDPFLAAMSGEVRSELDLGRFGSSANTPER